LETGIVILNYNNYWDTIKCIESIFKHCQTNSFQIVIIDNCSNNDSVSQIESFFKHNNTSLQVVENNQLLESFSLFTLIKNKYNTGYAWGNNIGIRFLIQRNIDFILILNNDILLTNSITDQLKHYLNNHPQIGIISPLIKKNDNTIDYNCCRRSPSNKILLFDSLDFLLGKIRVFKNESNTKYSLMNNPDLLDQELVICDIISGSCIMARSDTWKKLGGFDENTFLYFEENILFEKLNKLNLKTAILTTISVIHVGAQSTIQIKNTHLLRIALNSLKYYLKVYRKTNFLIYQSIIISRLVQIYLITIKNKCIVLINNLRPK